MLGMWRYSPLPDVHLRCHRPSGPKPCYKHNFKYRRVTLLADDLVSEHGIVSMRVGFALRSAEIKPLFDSVLRNLTKEQLDFLFQIHV
jgi:hypothetical protein